MARLASIEKAGFYPTPPRVVDLIASMAETSIGAIILDPCCGEGDALAALGEAWGAVTVGNELSRERAAKAAEKCDLVTHGPIEFLQVEGQVSCLFLNPPYDTSKSGQRLELQFLQYSNDWLASHGWLIWVIPEKVLIDPGNDGSWDAINQRNAAIGYLCSWHTNISVWRFPEPEYDRFKQVVVFARKLECEERWTYRQEAELKKELALIPTLGGTIRLHRSLPAITAMPTLTVKLPDAAETMILATEHGPTSTQAWENLTSPRGIVGKFQPVNHPLPGHAAMLVMDGKVDGTEVVSEEGDRLLLRGTNIKVVKTEETSERDGDKVRMKKVDRERVVSVIHALNMDSGELENYSSQNAERFEGFLRQHQDILIGAVDKLYPPLFVPNRDMPNWVSKLKRIHGPRPLPGKVSINGLLPKQAEAAVALAMLLEKQKAGLLIGECGVGKTCISLALQGLTNGGNFRVVVMAPAQTLPKWKREAERVLQEFGLKAHIIGRKRKKGRAKPILDIVEAMEEPNPSLLVMSFETAKNGPPWVAAFNVRKRKIEWWETETRHLNYYPYAEEVQVKREGIFDVAFCPDCGEMLVEENGAPWPVDRGSKFWKRQKRFCECGSALFQDLPFKYGGRVAAATFLNRRYAGKFALVIDEAHNTKGRDTDIGQASMKLISAARKVIGMTGTIYNGKASGIFAILYRLLPEFRQLYDFSSIQRFVEHHGLQETITTKTEKANSRYTSSWGYGKENVRTKEIPGVTPGIISWILRMAIFVRKEHVARALPGYTEYRVPVELAKSQHEVVRDLNRAHGPAVSKCRKGKMGLMSQWLYAACGALDYNEPDVIADDEDSFSIAGATVGPGELLPKDQAILDLVRRELAEGRGVGIYFAQVNRRGWMPRFQQILKDNNIYSEILRADTCKKADREKWFQGLVKRCEAKGQPVVLLANGNLVKEGLDLVECPTLIETGIDFRLTNVLQRDQRAHRITQEKDCKVYFLYYEGTFQEKALSLVAAKARAAKKVEGKLIDGLAQMGAEEDLMSALMKAAQDEEQDFTAVDWGDLQVEDIRPEKPKLVVRASARLDEAGNPRCTGIGLVPKEPSTSKEPVAVGEYQQLALF